MSDDIGQIIVLTLVLSLVLAVYLLPAIVASKRHHPHSRVIWLLNILLGWTLAPWIILIVWATRR